ncbi:MAG: DJ-1/PfpI family protein [Firmicutes bacterium]|nr:DJ-1/PfpI family protein [Bacillota bacterium]
MSKTQKVVALIIAEKNFRDEEYQTPKEMLEQAGVKVFTVSTSLKKAIGKLGMEAQPDLLISALDKQGLDALIFVGGGGSSQYFKDPTAHSLAWKFFNQGKIVGAICIAPVILAEAGILKGIKATVFPDGKNILEEKGAVYTGKMVEIDRTAPSGAIVITGAGPEAAPEFGRELVKLLAGLGS